MFDGPFTAAQARDAGYRTADVRRSLRSGSWVPLRRGVYVDAAHLSAVANCAQRRHALEVAGLLLALGFDAVAGGTSAARILGIELLGGCGPEPVLLTDAPVKGTHRDGYLLRSAALPAHHCANLHGVPMTSAARTVVDLARTESFAAGVVAADSALHQGLVSVLDLRRLIDDCHAWSGIVRARRVVDFADPEAESVLESLSRVAMHEQGLPAPRTQVTLGDGSGPRCRVDFLWDDVRVVGEADGLGKYEPSASRTTRDIVRAEKRREEWLADAGYEVVRWGWADANDQPRLARRLCAAFARGADRQRGRQQREAA